MAINGQDALVAAQAAAQSVVLNRNTNRTTVAAIWWQTLDQNGNPGAGTLAGTSTTAGVVPTDGTAGCPPINSFAGGATGYITAIDFGMNLTGRLRLVDCLWKGGTYAFNANVTLSAQPSYSGRIPNSDYKGTEIWIEGNSAFTGNPTYTINYTNQDGTTGRVATASPGAAIAVGRMFQAVLQSPDTGVQKIESVVGSVASAGNANVLVLRPLWSGRCPSAGGGDTHGPDKTDLPIVFDTSALMVQMCMDSTVGGIFEMNIGIGNA